MTIVYTYYGRRIYNIRLLILATLKTDGGEFKVFILYYCIILFFYNVLCCDFKFKKT